MRRVINRRVIRVVRGLVEVTCVCLNFFRATRAFCHERERKKDTERKEGIKAKRRERKRRVARWRVAGLILYSYITFPLLSAVRTLRDVVL